MRNGFVPDVLTSVWSNHQQDNIGRVYNLNHKHADNDLYTFNANTSFELVPGGSGSNRHNIQFGIMYEQTRQRGYDINPFALWTTARLHANEHIEGQGLDSTQVLEYVDGIRSLQTIIGTIVDLLQIPIYAPATTSGSNDNLFFRRVRGRLGHSAQPVRER